MIHSHKLGVVAIVVTYQPSFALLEHVLNAIVSQVDAVLVVDNGSVDDLESWIKARKTQNVEVLPLGTNRGIASAHNAGIQWARDRGSRFVLLMDQDSIPAADMVDKLAAVITERPSMAAVGPRYLDERRNNPPPFIRIRGLTLDRRKCDAENSVVAVDYLISSGCLIPVSVLDKVGDMRDDLFVDYVDIEWGLRARHHGLQSYGVCSAHMQHNLGDQPIKFFSLNIPSHSPLRHYYLFRNAVLLYKEPWVPFNWKLVDGWRLCLKYVFYSLFAKPRMAHWRMMTLGVWDGLADKTGKLEGVAS